MPAAPSQHDKLICPGLSQLAKVDQHSEHLQQLAGVLDRELALWLLEPQTFTLVVKFWYYCGFDKTESRKCFFFVVVVVVFFFYLKHADFGKNSVAPVVSTWIWVMFGLDGFAFSLTACFVAPQWRERRR